MPFSVIECVSAFRILLILGNAHDFYVFGFLASIFIHFEDFSIYYLGFSG